MFAASRADRLQWCGRASKKRCCPRFQPLERSWCHGPEGRRWGISEYLRKLAEAREIELRNAAIREQGRRLAGVHRNLRTPAVWCPCVRCDPRCLKSTKPLLCSAAARRDRRAPPSLETRRILAEACERSRSRSISPRSSSSSAFARARKSPPSSPAKSGV